MYKMWVVKSSLLFSYFRPKGLSRSPAIMKIPILFAAATFAGHATAFWGQLKAGAYNGGEGEMITQDIYLTDYNTGSTYYTLLHGGFNACGTGECDVL